MQMNPGQVLPSSGIIDPVPWQCPLVENRSSPSCRQP